MTTTTRDGRSRGRGAVAAGASAATHGSARSPARRAGPPDPEPHRRDARRRARSALRGGRAPPRRDPRDETGAARGRVDFPRDDQPALGSSPRSGAADRGRPDRRRRHRAARFALQPDGRDRRARLDRPRARTPRTSASTTRSTAATCGRTRRPASRSSRCPCTCRAGAGRASRRLHARVRGDLGLWWQTLWSSMLPFVVLVALMFLFVERFVRRSVRARGRADHRRAARYAAASR